MNICDTYGPPYYNCLPCFIITVGFTIDSTAGKNIEMYAECNLKQIFSGPVLTTASGSSTGVAKQHGKHDENNIGVFLMH